MFTHTHTCPSVHGQRTTWGICSFLPPCELRLLCLVPSAFTSWAILLLCIPFTVFQTCLEIIYLEHKHQRTDFLHLGLVTILGFLFLSLSTVGHFHSLFVHFPYSPCFLILLFLGMHCSEGVPSEVISTSLSSSHHMQFIYPLSLDTPGKALLKNWPSVFSQAAMSLVPS